MKRIPKLSRRVGFSALAFLLLLPAARASAQSALHVLLVSMVAKPNGQFAFEPAAITAQRGDTVRFVEASTVPHNVHFEKMPKGAALGAAVHGPYLIGAGKKYDLVIDARFVVGEYAFVCDPHAGVGMRGTLTVRAFTK